MSPWEPKQWYPHSSKKPPPEHGIKIKKAGTTWWGKRWIEALRVVLRGHSGRLERGATYARAGRTHDLTIVDGKVRALVTGSRATPYEVQIELTRISDDAWRAAIAAMAQRAQFSAELLAGAMPTDIDEAFRSAGVSLFPARREELDTDCSCPDTGDPCKHIAATHYVLGDALDRDPFLLFELRGRTKTQVLAALRLARGGDALGANAAGEAALEPVTNETPSVTLANLPAHEYDKVREPLPTLEFSFTEPPVHAALLRQLGTPASWKAEASPADVLAPVVRAAAEAARKLALSEALSSEAPSASKPATPERGAKASASATTTPERSVKASASAPGGRAQRAKTFVSALAAPERS
ncbi:MAG: SWIM zinc finger family protein, partial [Myxococcota bacterium]